MRCAGCSGRAPENRRSTAASSPRWRRKIVSRHPRDVAVQLDLARACIASGDMFLADTVLKPLLQIAPDDPHVWRLLGEVFLRAGNARDAETAFEGAIARGLRDTDTMRWHEKARGCRNLQDSGGHPAVAAEVLRWTESWGGAKQRLLESPDSQRTVIREPHAADLNATVVREPHAADLELSDKIPDSDRTAFYKKPDVPMPLAQANVSAPYPPAPPLAVAAPLPRVAPPPPRIADTQPQTAASDPSTGGKGLLDEESMDIDVLKLPEGDKLNEVLEALRKSEGLVIEDPTGFYQVPQGLLPPEGDVRTNPISPDILALAREGKLPNAPFGGTMLMPPNATPNTMPMSAVGPGHPPAPPAPGFPPPPRANDDVPTGPSRRIESGSGAGRAIESPSGVIINAPMGGEADAMAPTARASGLLYAPDAPAGMLIAGPPPHLAGSGAPPPLPQGPGPAATTVRPPKGKGRTVLVVALLLILALAGGAYYAIRVRGLIRIGAVRTPAVDAQG